LLLLLLFYLCPLIFNLKVSSTANKNACKISRHFYYLVLKIIKKLM
jgi:hypothetical protein